ncbi:hypothetical protein [Pseudoxanthomonas sp. Root630]|uniref:hypothetical protein n=1 Tax=Pseudoxanthomonas sp. Root630 TaxID=1736574 RepID=UPI000702F735|nr:hypothetical protein [Pseudoxanthomonas sp. Root630]KRA43001.1 hypothetical protein ASD72_13180 [Pseudoxanthomonas sp. Root630]
MTSSLDTNRELYLAIARLVSEHEANERSLEVFLLAMERRVSFMPEISWEQFKDFLVCGQIYE